MIDVVKQNSADSDDADDIPIALEDLDDDSVCPDLDPSLQFAIPQKPRAKQVKKRTLIRWPTDASDSVSETNYSID